MVRLSNPIIQFSFVNSRLVGILIRSIEHTFVRIRYFCIYIYILRIKFIIQNNSFRSQSLANQPYYPKLMFKCPNYLHRCYMTMLYN